MLNKKRNIILFYFIFLTKLIIRLAIVLKESTPSLIHFLWFSLMFSIQYKIIIFSYYRAAFSSSNITVLISTDWPSWTSFILLANDSVVILKSQVVTMTRVMTSNRLFWYLYTVWIAWNSSTDQCWWQWLNSYSRQNL